ncbi:MAG: dihydroorotate dehydrogenase-like protein [Capsulimonadaceae bacterium]
MELSTTYLGLNLKHPIVASSSPLSHDADGVRRLEDAGASAIVLPSLFEEYIEQESGLMEDLLNAGTESFAESLTYLPARDPKMFVPDEYLQTIQAAKAAADVPIIASLNGITGGGWTRHASLIEQAGADALELNIYFLSTDPQQSSEEVERHYLDAVRAVVAAVKIPVAVKVGPYISSLPSLARRFALEGVRGLVLFNRFYQPDLDLENLDVTPGLNLSRSEDLRLPLRWTAILHGRVGIDLAVSGGIHTHIDVLKAMMAGGRVSMMASELLQNGLGRIAEILAEVEQWMDCHEYESIAQMQGSMSQRNVPDPAAFERANYMKVLYSYRAAPNLAAVLPMPGRRPV